jgi:hypothetical protein
VDGICIIVAAGWEQALIDFILWMHFTATLAVARINPLRWTSRHKPNRAVEAATFECAVARPDYHVEPTANGKYA